MRYLSALLLLTATYLQAQTEAALKAYFEGKKATLKLDMPGSKEGVEVYPKTQPMVNPKHYQSSLLHYGPSMRTGDSFTFTALRVNEKSIEFQLQGGDYGILGDDTSSSPLTTKIPKEPHASTRHVLGNGRFTLWYPDKSLRTTIPEPVELQRVLGEYVDFGQGSSGTRPQISAPSQIGTKLKKGMTEIEVLRLLGTPRQSREHQEGDLKIVTNTFLSAQESIEVDFVNNTVVNYRIRPR
jgi:hypothetical protein